MNAADVMTTRTISVAPETRVIDAARLMLQNRVSGLPVVGPDGALLGIVTEGDLLRRAELSTERKHSRWLEFFMAGKLAEDYTASHAQHVADVMTREVETATESTPARDVVAAMEQHHVKRIPVLRDGRLVGIVSRADLLRALVRADAGTAPAETSDAAICSAFNGELHKQPWAPAASVTCEAKDGIVTLHGVILDDRDRAALRVLAENLPGVKEVRDHLTWVEPMSGLAVMGPDERIPSA